MAFTSCLALVALGCTAAPLPEDLAYRWRLEKGKPFYQTVTTTARQEMTALGSEVKQTQKQTFVFSWTPVERKAPGVWVLRQKLIGLRMDIAIGGQTTRVRLRQTRRIVFTVTARNPFLAGLLAGGAGAGAAQPAPPAHPAQGARPR